VADARSSQCAAVSISPTRISCLIMRAIVRNDCYRTTAIRSEAARPRSYGRWESSGERSRARRWWPPLPGTDDNYGTIRFLCTPFIWHPLSSSSLITRNELQRHARATHRRMRFDKIIDPRVHFSRPQAGLSRTEINSSGKRTRTTISSSASYALQGT